MHPSLPRNLARGARAFAVLFALLTVVMTSAHAQSTTPPGSVGLGGQIGDPSGITLKWYDRPGFAYEVLAAWDLDDFLFLNLHGLFERRLQDSPLNYFFGPGAYIGVEDRGDNDLVLGISGSFGLNFFTERFEVFLQLTPRLNVVPNTRGELGGGVGLRYYF